MTPQPDLVLASASPRRSAILSGLGLRFSILPAELDESVRSSEAPRRYVERVAAAKAGAIAAARPAAVVLGADTAVTLDERILGKPADAAEAERMLRMLSGRTHRVYSAVAVHCGGAKRLRTVASEVRFRRLGHAEIRRYIASGEPMDKAGAYAVQGLGGIFVEHLAGSYSAVVGLPVAESVALLRQCGIDPLVGFAGGGASLAP